MYEKSKIDTMGYALFQQSKDLSKRVTSKKVNLYTYGKVTYVYKLLFYFFTRLLRSLLCCYFLVNINKI